MARGIDDDGRAISRDPSSADPVSVDTSAVPRDSHPLASSPDDLARLTCEQDLRSFNASRGCLASPTHYSGQRDVGTGMMHHHSTAKALFAGFRSRNELPHVLRPFVGSNSEGDHFCLCRPGGVCASGGLCSNAARLTVTVCVQWHRQVSCARAAL